MKISFYGGGTLRFKCGLSNRGGGLGGVLDLLPSGFGEYSSPPIPITYEPLRWHSILEDALKGKTS